MSSKTKIVVLRMKEIIYTAIFIGFGILLVMLLFIMFHPKKENSSDSASPASYIPGVYSSSLTLGSQEINGGYGRQGADLFCLYGSLK